MYDTSVDIMYGAITLAILVFTGFLVWIMFYIAQILKQGNEVITEFREKMAELEAAIEEIKDKVMTSANAVTFIAGEIGNIVEFVRERKPSTKSRRKK